jgi:hypothetical protein
LVHPSTSTYKPSSTQDDPFYPICGVVVETTGHILWSCLSTRDAWSICGKRLQKTSVENEEFIHIVEELLDKLDDEEFSILALVARNL